MKKFFILFNYLLISSFLIFSSDTINEPRWVSADVGLRMRESPDLNTKLIVTIPFGEEVVLLEEKGEDITISGATGKWSKIKWKNKEGWVFGGFLTKNNPNKAKVSTKDLFGEWSYYFEKSDKPVKFFLLEEKSIVIYEPIKRESLWYFSENTIYADFDTGGQMVIKIEWKILDYKTDYIKVQQTWSALDTTTTIIELYRNAKEITSGKEEIKSFTGHSDGLTTACFSPDGKYILSGSYDMSVKLWDVNSGKEIKTLTGHTTYVNSVDISQDNKYALSGSSNKVIYWNIMEGTEINRIVINNITIGTMNIKNPIITSCFSPDGKFALLGLKNGLVWLYDLKNSSLTKSFSGHTSDVKSVSYSPNGKYILTGSFDKTVKLWDAKNEKLIYSFILGYSDDYDKLVYSVCISKNSKYALSGSGDNVINLWEIESGKWINSFKGHKENINSVCFTPDSKYILSGSDDGTVKLWEIASGNVIKTFKTFESNVYAVDISQDGKYALSAQWNSIKLWDLTDLIK